MNKKELKTLIAGLSTSEQVTVTFLGDLVDNSGVYEVLGVKTGRGKGGSKNMVLKAADGTLLEVGTPQSESILHVITADGLLHGFETAEDMPKSYETNAGRATELKAQMVDLVGTVGARVRLRSTEPQFDGDFTVAEAELLRGRYGQVRFVLEDDSGATTQLWSFRHSGIVTSFEVLSVPTQDSSATTEA
jgi:hypothetical protein